MPSRSRRIVRQARCSSSNRRGSLKTTRAAVLASLAAYARGRCRRQRPCAARRRVSRAGSATVTIAPPAALAVLIRPKLKRLTSAPDGARSARPVNAWALSSTSSRRCCRAKPQDRLDRQPATEQVGDEEAASPLRAGGLECGDRGSHGVQVEVDRHCPQPVRPQDRGHPRMGDRRHQHLGARRPVQHPEQQVPGRPDGQRDQAAVRDPRRLQQLRLRPVRVRPADETAEAEPQVGGADVEPVTREHAQASGATSASASRAGQSASAGRSPA